MTTVEWFAFAMVAAFSAGVVVALVVAGVRTGYWRNDR
jgi:hypothetical protein